MILARRWSRKAYQGSILGNTRQSADVAEAKDMPAIRTLQFTLRIRDTAVAEVQHKYRDERRHNRSVPNWSKHAADQAVAE
jgi:hypothetical protein